MNQNIQIGYNNPDITAQQGAQQAVAQQQQKSFKEVVGLQNAAHPEVCFASMFFKAVAFICYMIFNHGPLASFVNAFITTTILLAIDFWFVKNVAGRLLVGLRWWNKINDDGSEEWIYESKDTEDQANRVDYVCFWYPQVIMTIVWIVFLIINVIGLSWALACLDIVCFVLSVVNTSQFYKCSKHHQDKLKNLQGQLVQKVAQKAVDTAIQNPALLQNAARNMV